MSTLIAQHSRISRTHAGSSLIKRLMSVVETALQNLTKREIEDRFAFSYDQRDSCQAAQIQKISSILWSICTIHSGVARVLNSNNMSVPSPRLSLWLRRRFYHGREGEVNLRNVHVGVFSVWQMLRSSVVVEIPPHRSSPSALHCCCRCEFD